MPSTSYFKPVLSRRAKTVIDSWPLPQLTAMRESCVATAQMLSGRMSRQFAALPQVSEQDVQRWDREWQMYLASESLGPYTVDAHTLKVIFDVAPLKAEQVFHAALTESQIPVPLHVWIDGKELSGKDVLEIGCGCGLLARQLGHAVKSFLGIDISRFAIDTARVGTLSNCHFLHMADHEGMQKHAASYDTMAGREFFIHQNFERVIPVLRLANYMLRPGGLVSADFYWPDLSIPQGVVHPARAPLDPQYASCAFRYEDSEINEVAATTGFAVDEITVYKPYQRKFALLRKL